MTGLGKGGTTKAALGSVLLVVGMAGVTACPLLQSQQATPGKALRPATTGFRYEPAVPIPVGQQFVIVFSTLENVSDTPLTIKRIEAGASTNVPRTMKVQRIEVIPRTGIGAFLPMGRYLTHPPVVTRPNKCGVVPVEDPSGYELIPSDRELRHKAIIAMWMRAVAPGRASTQGQRVIYEQDGNLFEQTMPFSVRVTVKAGVRPLTMEPSERRCSDQHGVKILIPH